MKEQIMEMLATLLADQERSEVCLSLEVTLKSTDSTL